MLFLILSQLFLVVNGLSLLLKFSGSKSMQAETLSLNMLSEMAHFKCPKNQSTMKQA